MNILNRSREWRLTPKGWFCYDLCVPEPPEVSELVDGSQMVRVRPLDETCRAWTKKCVQSLGYQGNNLLCSNWDVQNLQDLDYIGAFEYLYRMKYGKPLDQATYEDGIPAEEFENVILDYLPVDAQQLRTWAGFNEARQRNGRRIKKKTGRLRRTRRKKSPAWRTPTRRLPLTTTRK